MQAIPVAIPYGPFGRYDGKQGGFTSLGFVKVNTPSIRRERHEERRPRPFIAPSGQGEAAAATVVVAASSTR